ncbi:MAG: hydroxymethylglutaryl-CoA reductase, degradative [Nanoarchaeota archaeon]|nr:hydroxymethylglutaryl-CoA reductase, degradative [Nanoarchaeota archaeon]MBU4300715.1 hydroxymethylglutaryl-CoA reductase, degradative [Nanoarchaeota archaeon]MBU4451772.1 hydroxymethylglutaryl-CoA reductase, degradative [Nanoarchaeota archaeon]MCG2723499.1 hydroxymethylglutaryl-CoA reductase, degradative [archaeon]
MPEKTSKLSGFYKLTLDERAKIVADFAGLTPEETNALKTGGLPLDTANRMIENVIGKMEMPLGIAANFRINGKDYLIPMALEEPSVVAAASNMAKLARTKGGFSASSTEPIMIGQIQLINVKDPKAARAAILAKKSEIIAKANEVDPILVKFGGGARDIEVRIIDTEKGLMLIVHLLVDCRDAMGANAVNTMSESVKQTLEEISGGKALIRIISNLAIYRLARATAVFDKTEIGGEDVVDKIILAWAFADADPFRGATHNKGIMNGIDSVAIATGNDFRAIEAGAHAYAAYSGKYTIAELFPVKTKCRGENDYAEDSGKYGKYKTLPGKYKTLTKWSKNSDGDLIGEIELPIAAGIIGGATGTNPIAKTNLKILGVKTARELSEVMASVGLAQNLGALKALTTEGIQRGHMELHARNIAIMAGAEGVEIDKVVDVLVAEKKVRVDRAKEVLDSLKKM